MNNTLSPEQPAAELVIPDQAPAAPVVPTPSDAPATTPSDPYSVLATRILELGEPCRAAVVRVQALGMRNAAGEEMYALLLTLLDGVGSGCPIWIGVSVPAAALKLVHRGSVLPTRRLAHGDDRDVAIDWQLAVLRPLANAA